MHLYIQGKWKERQWDETEKPTNQPPSFHKLYTCNQKGEKSMQGEQKLYIEHVGSWGQVIELIHFKGFVDPRKKKINLSADKKDNGNIWKGRGP